MYSCKLMCIPARVAYGAITISAAHIFHSANNCTEFETTSLQHEPCQQQTTSNSKSTKQAERTNKGASTSTSPSWKSSAQNLKTSASPIVTTWNDKGTSLSITVHSPVRRLQQQQQQQQQESTIEESQYGELDVKEEFTKQKLNNAQNEQCKKSCDNNNSSSKSSRKEMSPETAKFVKCAVGKDSKLLQRNHDGNSSSKNSKSANSNVPGSFVQSTNLQEPFTEPIKRIILVRNGLSEANVDVSKYVYTPDWRIPIVEEGEMQAIKAGRALATLVDNDPIYFYYSPYIRSRQSLRFILQGMSEQKSATDIMQQAESVNCGELENNANNEHVQFSHSAISNTHRTENNEKDRLFSGKNSWCDDIDSECNLSCHTWLSGNDTARENLFEACELSNELLHSECKHMPENTSSSSLHSPSSSFSKEENTLNTNSHPESKSEEQTRSQLQVDKCSSTASLLLSRSFDNIVGVREDVRLRDGDIGRYQSMDELIYHLEERERYGQFFYRFPHGESGADVCDRVTSFLDAFQRERVMMPMNTNVVIVTHGLAIRMFIARWFHLTVDTFHRMRSPPPGAICTLTRICHQSRFRLNEECLESMRLPVSLNDKNGYKYRNKQLLGSLSSGAPYM